MSGDLDYTRLVCPLCITPYDMPQIRLETFVTGIRTIDILLYNSTGVSILVNYISILFGVHSGHTLKERLIAAQLCIYFIYAILYCLYVRIQNIELYTKILMQRRGYVYLFIQVYASYAAYTEQYALMSLTAMTAQTLLWKEHVSILRTINQEIVKNN
jgi:hypothetical protein